MQLRPEILRGVARGLVTLAFRRLRRPTIQAGSSLRTTLGKLHIEGIRAIEARDISEQDARQAGFESRRLLLASLRGEGTLYRIELSFQGRAHRAQPVDRGDSLAQVREQLRALDRRAVAGPWTMTTLCLVRERAGASAAALSGGRPQDDEQLARNLRKLKSLGLLEQRQLGYHLTERAQALLGASPV